MREEGHINLLQGVVLVYAALSAKLFIQFPTFLIHVGGPAAWQVALVLTAMAILLFLPIGALAGRFPGKGLAEISEEVAGPFVGGFLSLCVVMWLFLSLVSSLRNFAETYIATILPNTPPSVLTLVALGSIAYASYLGVESLSRGVQVLLPVILAGAALVLFFSYPRIDTSRLQPFWGHGMVPSILGGAYYSGVAGEAILLLVLGYAFRSGKDIKRGGLLAILFFG
ncbi:MAG TPA: GerAB/ArcD/ProY family transporter, partial [Symbiobacteriaceae bacterium]|nr:GerAB/ArcD/ProY family transporter [Symbiobacteriaceae bacterium]